MPENWEQQRNQIIGLGENSFKKSYYPELQLKISELEISYNNMQTIFNSINDGICIHDEHGHIFLLNEQAQTILNIKGEDIKQTSIMDISSPQMNTNELTIIWKDVLNGHHRVIDWTISQLYTKNEIYVQVSINKILWDNKELLVAVIRDFSERIKFENELIKAKEIALESKTQLQIKNDEYEALNEELRQTNEELKYSKEKAEESDRLKTAFLQNMSHEIRTPMNAIMGFTSLLANNFDNKEKLENFSQIIDSRCNDLMDIINDVLDISKIESAQITLNIENCNLNELFDELGGFFNDYMVRINKNNIKLVFNHVFDQSYLLIKTDKLKLKQILINLISNAFKFTEEGTITCGYNFENDKLLFYVSDTGIGIPADKYDFIFERFSQLKHPSLQNIGGTGLGLSIVKKLVEVLGGEIWLESECNKGTTFYFTIDCVKSDLLVNRVKNTESQEKLISDKKILIVEDDFYNATYLKEVLGRVTSHIETVNNGLSAVKITQEQKFDLVFMDIRLPDITGYEATQLILKNEPGIKIIAQTAYAANTEHQKAIESGCVDYISKPIKKEKLLTLVKKYLE